MIFIVRNCYQFPESTVHFDDNELFAVPLGHCVVKCMGLLAVP